MNKLIKLSIACSALALLSACGGGGSNSGGDQAPVVLSVNGNPPSAALATHCLSIVPDGPGFSRMTNNCDFTIYISIFESGGTRVTNLTANETVRRGTIDPTEAAACEAPFSPAEGPNGFFCKA